MLNGFWNKDKLIKIWNLIDWYVIYIIISPTFTCLDLMWSDVL